MMGYVFPIDVIGHNKMKFYMLNNKMVYQGSFTMFQEVSEKLVSKSY